MCQLPFIRMWVWSTRSPEKAISRCLPRADTDSIVRPAIGRSSSTRVSAGNDRFEPGDHAAGENAVQRLRGAKIVSPSGNHPLQA